MSLVSSEMCIRIYCVVLAQRARKILLIAMAGWPAMTWTGQRHIAVRHNALVKLLYHLSGEIFTFEKKILQEDKKSYIGKTILNILSE